MATLARTIAESKWRTKGRFFLVVGTTKDTKNGAFFLNKHQCVLGRFIEVKVLLWNSSEKRYILGVAVRLFSLQRTQTRKIV